MTDILHSPDALNTAGAPGQAAQLMEQLSLGVLVIQPSPFCNINCDYCYLPNRTSTQRMEFEVLETVMSKVFDSGLVGPPFTLLWHAGEPLAVPIKWYERAFEIIDRFPNAKEVVQNTIQSNGTLINQAWCDFIIKHKIEVGLSIDGPAFIHDANRKTRKGEGTHAKALRGAEMLKKNGIPFGVIAVISETSLEYPDEIYDFFIEMEIDGVGFNIEEVEGANESSSFDKKEKSEERVRSFLQRVYDRNKADGYPLRVREFETARQNILDPNLNRAPDGRHYNVEADPLGIVSVDCFGNFSTFSPEMLGQATEKYGSFTFGNLIKASLFDATENKEFQAVLADIDAGNQICAASCPFWEFCGGASPSNKYYENGTFNSGETRHCRCMVQMPLEIVLEDLEETFEAPCADLRPAPASA